MNKQLFLTCVVAVTMGTAVLRGWGAEKIGTVDMGRIMDAHPDTAAAEALLEQEGREFETEQQEIVTEFELRKEAFLDADAEANNMALSEEGRRLKREKAAEMRADLLEYEKEVQERVLLRRKQLAKQGRRMRERIVTKLRKIVGDYADRQKLTLVLDSSLGGAGGTPWVVYHLDKIDITDDILELIRSATAVTGESE